MNKQIRIVSVGSEELLNLIHVVLDRARECVLVNEYTQVSKAVKMLNRDLPDIVLVDLSTPDCNGSSSIKRIKETLPYIEIVVISDFIEDKLLKECISHGASGFIEKSKELPTQLLHYMIEVSKGGVAMSSKQMRALVESLWINPFSPLTSRETEILKLMSEGCTYTEIGKALEISAETSKTHIRNIYKKLKVNKKSTALDKARFERLV